MAIDWTRTICIIDEDTVNLICGKEIFYVRGIAAGRGIQSITKTASEGYVDTYTILYTDGTTSTFEVTNGSGSGGGIPDVPNDGQTYIRKNQRWNNLRNSAIFYVSQTGSDSNTGTSDSPFRTITKALSLCVPNTSSNLIYIANGTYPEDVTITALNVILISQGTVNLTGAWTIVKSYVELQGTLLAFRNGLSIYNGSNVIDTGISNLSILKSSGTALYVYGSDFFVQSTITLSAPFCIEAIYSSHVYIANATLNGNNGITASRGAIVAVAAISGSATSKSTIAGGRIFTGVQADNEGYSKTEVDNLLNGKADSNHTHNDLAPKESPALTGTPTAPTAARGTDTTQLATTAFVQDALVTGFRDVYKVTLPSVSSSKLTFTATGITVNHVMVVEGYAYFSNPSAVASKLTIATSANKITIAGTLSGTTDIIVTLGIPRTITAS